MPTKKKSTDKTKKNNSKIAKDKGPKDYCNILDKLHKEQDGPELVNALAELCLTNIFTQRARTKKGIRPRTFMYAPGMNKSADALKRQMFIGFYSKEGLAKIAKKDDPMVYNMLGEGYKVEIKSNAVHINGSKIEKELPSANGMLLIISDPLKPGKMRGGGKTYKVRGSKTVDHPILKKEVVFYDDLSGLSGLNLRWNILENYRRMWPLYDWSLYDDFNYYNWAYSSLISYLSTAVPNFYTLYEPYPDPLVGLESLLQYRMLDTGGYWLPDSLLQAFVASPYWLTTDPKVIEKAKIYLGGGGRHQDMKGGLGGIGWPIIKQDTVIIENYINPFKMSLEKVLKDPKIPEQKKRMYVIDIYKKLENDDEFRGKEGRNVMKRVGSQIHMVSLGRHLDAFLTYNIRNYLAMPMSGGKSEEITGGGGEFTIYSPSLFDEIRCLFGTVKYPDLVDLILQPKLTSGYRFGMDFINKFCLSPYCLYVAGLSKNLGKTTLKSPYIPRANFKTLGYTPPKKDSVLITTGDSDEPEIGTGSETVIGTTASGLNTDASAMGDLMKGWF